ncbi:alpha-1,6-glucosidase domain-containing protein [Roseateles sp.]|uniref:alpha-1,6-glucosidase domain-containing protein n=1 Tax=Roseateles sp. TaxID=1971397 RepID=UPI003BA970D5
MQTLRNSFWTLALVVALTACGGGGGSQPLSEAMPLAAAPEAGIGNEAAFQKILSAQPASPAADVPATTLTIHYRRTAGDYAGWQLHHWGAAAGVDWNAGRNADGSDAFGVYYNVPLAAQTGTVGYLFHKGDDKDHGGADQSYVLKAGKNEIWRIQGDGTTYASNPLGNPAPDITTVRVHYRRFDGNFAAWGLHLWSGSGLDAGRVPAGVAIGEWGNPVAFNKMPNDAAASAGEVVFDLPVLNPRDDASRKSLEFIIHGMPPNQDNKDGRPDNIRVDYGALTLQNQVGEVWIVQGDAQVYVAPPDTRSVSTTDARAYWLTKQLIQWPQVDSGGVFKLYHSANAQITAVRDGKVAGADGALVLDRFAGSVPAAAALRFKFIGSGVVLAVKDADLAQLGELHKKQLLLVQEDAGGNVQNATSAQAPGALDDLYAAGANVNDLGVKVADGRTTFKLWAPTAQRVLLFTYDSGTADAEGFDAMSFDAATGVWSVAKRGDLSGKYYRFAVEVFVRGVGIVRNLVTDPYSVSLTTDSKRSYIADLGAAGLKPAGWDSAPISSKVAAPTDMAIYELHVRDFSANDMSVSAANRGKYLAFTEAGSNGMKHLKALADAGLTDVHLLPVFDIASVPESGCTTPSPAGAPDGETQQAAVAATAAGDCFNWGYDPWHYNAPEGSYASSAADGARRIVEFRQMVLGLKNAGLRVGMDVVYNHTTASGQNEKSVLDRIVPGYYHRLDAAGKVTNSTCCDNTATENLMMAKLMSDSVLQWARDYKIDSFRFDIMGHQPRAVMEAMKARLKTTLGRDIQLIGEGWNFGEVADGARFVQATLYSLNGSGIGSFNPIIRDAVRGGGCCDNGTALVSNQGWVSGLYYDPNELGGGRSRTELMWLGDQIKASLAGSLRSYQFTTHWDELRTAESLGNFIGWSTQPDEVVNYVENHDNLTLFDTLALRLPTATSREDRARVQLLANALNAFSQGVAYFHAGTDLLRSKSLDRNSYDSGDWFNRLDWRYEDNGFGAGLPPQGENGANWSLIQPFLANASIKPAPGDIAWMRDAFRDLLKIRASSTLFRLRTADDIQARLKFLNTGSAQNPVVIAAALDGAGYAGAGFRRVVYLVNTDKAEQTLTAPSEMGLALELHPVHRAAGAADQRVATGARFDSAAGRFTLPARSAAVFVQR